MAKSDKQNENGISFVSTVLFFWGPPAVGLVMWGFYQQYQRSKLMKNFQAYIKDDLKKVTDGEEPKSKFDRCVTPTKGLESMVLAPDIKDSMKSIVHHTKAHSIMYDQWGFDKIHRATKGISAMFTGSPGTGKTMSAEALAFDLGRPLLVVNTAQLISKWMGEAEKNIQAVFEEAETNNAVLVFDEAEGLFASRTSSEFSHQTYTMCVGLLLQHIESHAGICIVVTNMKEMIDKAFLRRFRFVLHFDIPDADQRELIWKVSIPEECPLASDVSLHDIAKFELAGGDIKNALLHAATRAALRADIGDSKVTMEDLVFACDAELAKKDEHKQSERSVSMYS